MKPNTKPLLARQISSNSSIVFTSLACGISVLAAGLLLQWLVYDDWLHRSGIRLVGSLLSGVLMYILASRWQFGMRERKMEMLRRFETIARMNDNIRNALQAIECSTYATNPGATEPVRDAVDRIEGVLEEVLVSTSIESTVASKGRKLAYDALPVLKFR